MFYRNSSINPRSKRFIIVGKSGRSVSLPPSLTSGITFDGANRSVLINREAVLAELRRRLPPIRLSLSRAQGALINANTWNTTTYRRLFAFLPPGGSFFAGVPARSLYRGSASDGRNRGDSEIRILNGRKLGRSVIRGMRGRRTRTRDDRETKSGGKWKRRRMDSKKETIKREEDRERERGRPSFHQCRCSATLSMQTVAMQRRC